MQFVFLAVPVEGSEQDRHIFGRTISKLLLSPVCDGRRASFTGFRTPNLLKKMSSAGNYPGLVTICHCHTLILTVG